MWVATTLIYPAMCPLPLSLHHVNHNLQQRYADGQIDGRHARSTSATCSASSSARNQQMREVTSARVNCATADDVNGRSCRASSPVSPQVDELAGEVGRVVEADAGDVDVVLVDPGQPAQRVADQHQPVDRRQRDQQLPGRRPPVLGRRQEDADRERVADEADRDDDADRAEVDVESDVLDEPDGEVLRRRGRRRDELVRRPAVDERRRVVSIHRLTELSLVRERHAGGLRGRTILLHRRQN